MNQISNNLFSLKPVWMFIKNKFPDYVTTVLVVAFLFTAYSTITSQDYWFFIWTNIVSLFNILLSLFAHSRDYLFANIAILLIVIWLINSLKPKSWIEKVKYNQQEQLNFYLIQLVKQGAKINTKEELLIFCQDTVDILHNLFAQKSTTNNTTWLIPNGNKLELFCNNKDSKYNKEDSHFSFYAEEGVVGSSWAKGQIELYSNNQQNKLFKNRKQCSDKSYICSPIVEKPLNKYGVIAVGSDEDIYWEDEDIECLKLISTIVLKILNDLDDGIKNQFNLQTLQRKLL